MIHTPTNSLENYHLIRVLTGLDFLDTSNINDSCDSAEALVDNKIVRISFPNVFDRQGDYVEFFHGYCISTFIQGAEDEVSLLNQDGKEEFEIHELIELLKKMAIAE